MQPSDLVQQGAGGPANLRVNAAIAGEIGLNEATVPDIVDLRDTSDEVTFEAARPSLSLRRYVASLIAADLLVAALSAVAAITIRFKGGTGGQVDGVSYLSLLPSLPPAWLITMWLSHAYDERVLVSGTDEFRKVVNGSIWLLAVIASASFLLRFPVSRSVTALALMSVTAFSLGTRFLARRALQARLRGRATLHRAVVVGTTDEAERLGRHMDRNSHVGFAVTAVHSPRWGNGLRFADRLDEIVNVVAATGADTVAVASTSGFNSSDIRRLAWRLEGTGVRLMVVPALTDLAGPRIVMQPVDGLPLLHVEEPGFGGSKLVAKRCIDVAGGLILIVVLLPVLLAIALVVLVTSGRPVLFSQTRVGRHGKPFRMLKFRSMFPEAELAEVRSAEGDPVRTKPEHDPRITLGGRVLRRHSLDELPQLLNVLAGSMSLVGPRPHRPHEVAEYGDDARRRLLIKPGITGLWQVSGRAALPWDEAVRLDLRYVQNWSVWTDVVLLAKTAKAVLRPRGAY